jgi:hypothetical protein
LTYPKESDQACGALSYSLESKNEKGEFKPIDKKLFEIVENNYL